MYRVEESIRWSVLDGATARCCAFAMLVLASCGRFGFAPEDDVVVTLGGSEADVPRAIAVTAAGNIVIVGEFRDAVDFGCSSITATGGADGFLIELTPELECIRTWQVSGPGDDLAIDVDEDRFGNFFVTGEFRQTAAIGSADSELTAMFERDIYLTKLAATWATTWTRQLPGNSSDQTYELVNQVQADSSGAIHMFGRVWGSVNFGWGGPTQAFSDAGWGDAFVLRVGADGEYLGADTFGGGGSEHTYAMTIDENDRLYLAGAFRGTADFDPGPATRSYSGNFDGFIQQRMPDGTLAWLNVEQRGGWCPYHSIANKLGDELVAVQSDLTIMDTIVVRTSSFARADGALRWSREVVGPCLAEQLCMYVMAAATDREGNVYVGGRFPGSIDFDPGDGADIRTSNGGQDAFVQSYGPAGDYRWTMTFGGAGNDQINAIAVLDVDDIVVIGPFEESVDFSSVPSVQDIRASSGSSDVYVRRITR
ncbi:MAG TPA: hypothetical protein VIV11_18490 [Kofleriaceae bacterium]